MKISVYESYESQSTNEEDRFCFKKIIDSHNIRLAFVIVSSSFFRLRVCLNLLGVAIAGI